MYIKSFGLIRFGPRRSSKVVSFLSLSSLGWVEGGEVGVGVGGLLGYLLGYLLGWAESSSNSLPKVLTTPGH